MNGSPMYVWDAPNFYLRKRADGDGYSLLKDSLVIAGGSIQHCLETYLKDHRNSNLSISSDVAVAIHFLISVRQQPK